MKLFEVLNQAKATAEGISIDQAWLSLAPQVASAPEEVRLLLLEELTDEAAQCVHAKVVKNLKIFGSHE